MEWLVPHFTNQILSVYNQKVDDAQRCMLETDQSNVRSLCVCTRVYVCMYTHIHLIHTHTHTHTHTHRC
jgi:hypothetical protein